MQRLILVVSIILVVMGILFGIVKWKGTHHSEFPSKTAVEFTEPVKTNEGK